MTEKTFKVPNIGCDGCVRTVKSELSELAGVSSVEANLDKVVTVKWDNPASWEQIVKTLTEIDYAPVEA